MRSLQPANNSEVFIMRISPRLKQNLIELSTNNGYGGTSSSAIRVLIERATENL